MVKTKSKIKEDFPKITIDVAISYLKKIAEKAEGDIITYDDIGSSIKKAGGNLARIIGSLKEFHLIDKAERHKEWKITDLGQRIISKDSESDKLVAFLNPPIHRKIWETYKQTKPSSDVLTNYLKNGGFAQKPAKKLTKLFLKSYEQFSMKTPLTISQKEEEKTHREGVESKGANKKIYLAYLLSSIFPPKVDDAKKTLAEIIKIAKEENLQKLINTLEILEIQISSVPKENIKLELEKFSGHIKKVMKEELGIEEDRKQ